MDADQLLVLLGLPASDTRVEAALVVLRTRRRPQLDPADRDAMRDWVLVRRAGLEFGFVDEAFFLAQPKSRRRRKDTPLIVCQLYFYSQFDDISQFSGHLPFGLMWPDDRKSARSKLFAYESTRRSYTKDVWDVPGCRMTVDYKKEGGALDSILCRILPRPWPEEGRVQPLLKIPDWIALFGLTARSQTFQQALHPLDVRKRLAEDGDENEIGFKWECGVLLYFNDFKDLKLVGLARKAKPTDLVFSAVQFFRAREHDARQWTGELPRGISFDDSQETMVAKMGRPPDHRDDDRFAGLAVWHFREYSLELTYSNIDNHLTRVALMAPGYWKK